MLKLEYFDHLMQEAELEKTPILGRIEDKENALRGDRVWDGLNGHDFEQTPGDSEG